MLGCWDVGSVSWPFQVGARIKVPGSTTSHCGSLTGSESDTGTASRLRYAGCCSEGGIGVSAAELCLLMSDGRIDVLSNLIFGEMNSSC